MSNLNYQMELPLKQNTIANTDLCIHQKIHEKLDYFYESNKIPHIIFHGSSGSGKRTIVNRFLNKIYKNDKLKLKTNVMIVNCAHGKGIKFIREELKFFAKTNIQSNNGMLFKTIVLLNADCLTIDAQSALRRCIELFSYNTRFFIIVENKQKLLNPILSRFCEIYVPEHIVRGNINNLHQHNIKQYYSLHKIGNIRIIDNNNDDIDNNLENMTQLWIQEKIETLLESNKICHIDLTNLATEFYEKGLSCLDFIRWIENTELFTELDKSSCCMCFDKIKAEYRCEKLLLLYMFDFLFTRSNKDIKSISTI